MSSTTGATLPWPPNRSEDDPLRDVDVDRFMVFVPAIMSVGLIFSLMTLVRDALQRTGRWSRERRLSIETAMTVEDVLADSDSVATNFGLLNRSSYLATAALAGSAAGALGALSVINFLRATGDVRDIGWLLAVSLAVSAFLAITAAASLAVYRTWPHPAPWTLSTLRNVPLTHNLAREGRGPKAQLTVALLTALAATVIVTLIVKTNEGAVLEIDEPVLRRLVETDWLRHLAALDLFGSTVISIGFVALIGLSAFRCRVMAFVYPAAFAVSWAGVSLLQEIVARSRPVEFGDLKAFPSGHMVQAVFIAGLVPTALSVLLQPKGNLVRISRVVLGAMVVATAVLRVHREDHWPVDAVAGMLFGLVIVLGTHWVLEHRGWHQRCSSCPRSAHPAPTQWRRGVFDLHPGTARRIGWAGVAGAMSAAGALLVATVVVGLPTDPEGDGVGSAIADPAQVGLAVLMALAGLIAIRWKEIAAFLMALCATGLGLLASVEYSPGLAFLLALMLLVPAVLTWLAWQPHATVGTIAGLAMITATSLTATALGSREIYGYYFGPTHPESTAEALESEADWLWLGDVGTQSATIVAGGLEAGSSVELSYWNDSDPGQQTTASVDEDGLARFSLTNLEPDVEYSYSVISPLGTATERVGDASFRTHANGPQDLTVVVASCARNDSNGAVFDAMVGQHPDLYLALGDLHYASLASADPDDHLGQWARALSKPGQSALFRSVPTAYVWDDHDYGPNDGDRTSPSRLAVSTAYRQAVPHAGVDPNPEASIAQAFTVGRVRFVLSDTRSQRGEHTMLGETQLAWLLDELVSASKTHALVVWGNPTPWISSDGVGADDWSAFPGERRKIADTLAEAGVENLLMVSGDAHMLAIDDGTNSGYASDGSPGFPVLHAAALDRPGGEKGGPYSHGAFPGSGQYGQLEISDDGGPTVTVGLSGRNWEGEELVRYEFIVDAP